MPKRKYKKGQKVKVMRGNKWVTTNITGSLKDPVGRMLPTVKIFGKGIGLPPALIKQEKVMPAVTQEQQQLFGIALSMKRGETSYSYSPEAAKLARIMTEEQLRDYATTSFNGNPNWILDWFKAAQARFKGWWF